MIPCLASRLFNPIDIFPEMGVLHIGNNQPDCFCITRAQRLSARVRDVAQFFNGLKYPLAGFLRYRHPTCRSHH